MTSRNEFEEFLYFDEAGINSLADQIEPGRLESFSEETGSSKEGAVSLTPRLGFLSPIFSLGADLGLTGRGSRSRKTDRKFSATQFGRYQAVVTHLGGPSTLRKSLDDAWLLSLNKGTVYCIVSGRFVPDYPGEDWHRVANETKMLVLRNKNDAHFRVGMSLTKLVGIYHESIGLTSHLAVRLRNEDAGLRIFGRMDSARYIKPYVVSWA